MPPECAAVLTPCRPGVASERERISRELHDRVAHQSLELFSTLAESAPERTQEKLQVAKQSTRTARDLSAQLARRGSEETQDGLASALRALLATQVPDGVESDLSAEGDETAIPHPSESRPTW